VVSRQVFGDASFIVIAAELPERPGWVHTLTPAERAVLAFVGRGMRNAQIAEARGCGVPTVAKQLSALKRKTGCSERLALAGFGRRLRGDGGPGTASPVALTEIAPRAASRAHARKSARSCALTRDDATGIWRALLEGRATLADELDVDGRRLHVLEESGKPARSAALTQREHEVLRLVLARRQNKVIAWELGIATSTVSLRIHAICRKLGASDRSLLLELAELLSPP
jgi:DNA-binding NarL/FixJ family response regulator